MRVWNDKSALFIHINADHAIDFNSICNIVLKSNDYLKCRIVEFNHFESIDNVFKDNLCNKIVFNKVKKSVKLTTYIVGSLNPQTAGQGKRLSLVMAGFVLGKDLTLCVYT